MTTEQLHILQHSLGSDKYGRGYSRDYYCVGVEDEITLKDIRFLVSQGWMRAGHTINEGRDQYYFVTSLGLSAMVGESPKPPKLTRAQQRYQDFLHADCGMSFGKYLKWLHLNRDRIREIAP